MARPKNILNQGGNADRTLDVRIKQGVAATGGFTLLYLYANPISELCAGKIITFFEFAPLSFTPAKFLFALLVLNAVMLTRLGWRICISGKYNKYYDRAEKDFDDGKEGMELKKVIEAEEKAKEKRERRINEKYEENMKSFGYIDKRGIGLGIPIVISGGTMVWLICTMIKLSQCCH